MLLDPKDIKQRSHKKTNSFHKSKTNVKEKIDDEEYRR